MADTDDVPATSQSPAPAGARMLLVAVFSMAFGTIVDRHRKHIVMVFAGVVTLVAFSISGVLYLLFPESTLLDIGAPMFWLFSGIILFGAVIENMRNIALSTIVTLRSRPSGTRTRTASSARYRGSPSW